MYFDSFSSFIEMGNHGLYVWLAYGISLMIMLINVVAPLMNYNQFWRDEKNRRSRESVK